MKRYEDFLNDLKNNEKLKRKFEEAQNPKDACDILEKEGYKVSEDELTEFYLDNVAGGGALVDDSENGANLNIIINGTGNTALNFGSLSGRGDATGANISFGNVSPVDLLNLLGANRQR